MEKRVMITEGDKPFNQLIVSYLLEQGHQVMTCFENKDVSDQYFSSIHSEWQERYHPMIIPDTNEKSLSQIQKAIEDRMDGLDILIHGNEMVNEEQWLENNDLAFGDCISSQFEQIYLFNKMAAELMIRAKSGEIIFPLIYDPLYYADYASSPVLNQGKISMMKCLSRELSAFKINVNVMTFGYHEKESDRLQKRKTKKMVEIFSLKPALLHLKEMIPALDILINPPVKNIGGENFHIGTGIETSL
ncbi:SDR family NAD(P)-dependent oxidoreductase [Lentibacillus cibarius]|uniref:SDR family NAD(P)-dependent oxidoreductase n=1 Tax=Lentibacillus cibarius TaxID=2583219 RepID=UPI001486822F|nr:SDR family NAD(P)-dependent oxidoreductase [Lentibacillus cibarius]